MRRYLESDLAEMLSDLGAWRAALARLIDSVELID